LTSIRRDIVAIIDDDPDVRKATATLLSAFGYVTYTFKSAEPFLSVAATSKAKCLVVDVQLGDISGVELARQLGDAGFRFPIIFMTALDDEVISRQAEHLGCVAYLRKPFGADLLIEAIVRAIGNPSEPNRAGLRDLEAPCRRGD
jgi:FixJ family two-component response regulator